MAFVRIVIRKDKIRKWDDKAPLYLRLTHNRKSRYTSLGVFIDPAHWQEDRQRVSRSHPFGQRLNARLAHKRTEFEELALDLEDEKVNMAQKRLRDLLAGDGEDSFLEYAFAHVQRLAAQGQDSTAKVYEAAYRQFKAWLKNQQNRDDLSFRQFTLKVAQGFKGYLERQLGNHPNTVQVKFAALRRVMKLALREGLITDAQNTLRRVLTPGRKTRKVIPSREDMLAIEAVDLDAGSRMWNSCNLYLFASRMAGMRFSDALTLRWHQLQGEHLTWQTRKSRKQLWVYVPENVREIIAHYGHPDPKPNDFIFPFMRGDEALAGRALARRITSWNARCNLDLKAVTKLAGLARDFSFHTSRHFFATESLRRGVRVEVLQEILTHSSIEQTMAYVRISNADMDAAMGRGS